MNTLKACIFDLDGVLVDTAKYHFLSWKELSDSLNINFTIEDNERLKGVSRMDSLDIILELGNLNIDSDTKNKLAYKKNSMYCEFLKTMTESDLLPGAKSLLLDLKKHNIVLALGSASKNALTILNKLNITDLFDVIIDGNRVTKTKPDPEVFTLSADILKINYEDCIVFEDSIAGINAAKKANMKTIGIGSFKNLALADSIYADLTSLNYEILNNFFKSL